MTAAAESTPAPLCRLPRRLMAVVYDSLLLLALLIMATVPFIVAAGGKAFAEYPPHQFAMVVIVWLYFAGYWSYSGRTLGMQAWGLRVEDANGRNPSFASATVRFLVAILSWAALGAGFLWQLWDRDGLTWHDRASGTVLRVYPRD